MRGKRRSVLAACVFFAFTTPLGIAAHLISELAALGWHDDADVAFSARHGYLAILAAAALAVFAVALRALPPSARRERVADIIRGLPFEGRGASFLALSFVVQFAFFAITQIGEGCPLCGGDVVTGVVAAAIAALLGALIITFAKRRVLELALSIVWYQSHGGCTAAVRGRPLRGRVVARSGRRTPVSFRYRPPPIAA